MAGTLSETPNSSSGSQKEHIFIPYPHKPHKSNHPAWQAMNKLIRQEQGKIGLDQFQLLRCIGTGNTGNVYTCRIKNTAMESPDHCLYAMKVVDREALKAKNKKKKKDRVNIEREIVQMLDHPFLPILFAEFEASHYSCLVMEYCPGGNLLTVLQRQPKLRFNIPSAKFYAAEVLVALEYLHAMGIIYRDLKPENVLIQENGHIMLSDFDLSFKCDVIPRLWQHISKPKANKVIDKTLKYNVSCCVPSVSPAETSSSSSSKVHKQVLDNKFWAEPVDACSSSFVGTHEYLAPEVILGTGHGNGVDWWAFGIFLYELLHGKTPFRGETNEITVNNILKQPLVFPRDYANCCDVKQCEEMGKARDLVRKLLVKNHKKRMGSFWGSVEIKSHKFFKGVDWALIIRSVKPPHIPAVNNMKKKQINKNNNKVPHVDFF